MESIELIMIIIIIIDIKLTLCIKHYVKLFTGIISFKPFNKPLRQVPLFFPFHRWGNLRLREFYHSVKKLARIQSEVFPLLGERTED